MFGLLSRPARRPRTVRRPVRPALRVEALEARANPAALVLTAMTAPVLTHMAASWEGANHVTISGTVLDQDPAQAVIHVTGATQTDVHADASGNFVVSLETNGTDPVYVQVQDAGNLLSGTTTIQQGVDLQATNLAAPTAEQPALRDVTITCEGGTWHIRGHVDGGSPLGTVIKIISSSIPGREGNTVEVNPDGSFDIGINLDPNSPGGSISIIAIDGDTGNESGQWDGIIG
jgi:hypothetical protein